MRKLVLFILSSSQTCISVSTLTEQFSTVSGIVHLNINRRCCKFIKKSFSFRTKWAEIFTLFFSTLTVFSTLAWIKWGLLGLIWILCRVSLTASCSMDLALFPLDEQTCHLYIASCEWSILYFYFLVQCFTSYKVQVYERTCPVTRSI